MKHGKLITIILCLAMLLAGTTVAHAEGEQQNIIRVHGEGIVNVAPDRAELSLAIVTENADAGQAQAENAQKSARVIKALEQKGIPESDIQTRSYRLSPKYAQPPKPLEAIRSVQPGIEVDSQKITGYTLRHQIRVKVKDMDMVGELMDLAIKNGANQISNVSFSVSDAVSQKKEALRRAVADARAKAEVLAGELGKSITGVQSAGGSWHESNPGPMYYREMAVGAGSAAADEAIATGMAQVRASADITYLID